MVDKHRVFTLCSDDLTRHEGAGLERRVVSSPKTSLGNRSWESDRISARGTRGAPAAHMRPTRPRRSTDAPRSLNVFVYRYMYVIAYTTVLHNYVRVRADLEFGL